ncbi:hypothetical protein, partial [Endozoicomonas sp.]|uniref:hypothetical protein n=1 Tax=Endozoicomonas sp. TaxID=1892382 RepID=UPI00383B2701
MDSGSQTEVAQHSPSIAGAQAESEQADASTSSHERNVPTHSPLPAIDHSFRFRAASPCFSDTSNTSNTSNTSSCEYFDCGDTQGRAATAHRVRADLAGAESSESSGDEYEEARRVIHVYHDLYLKFLKRVHEAFHQGAGFSVRRISHQESTEQAGAINIGSSPGQPEEVNSSAEEPGGTGSSRWRVLAAPRALFSSLQKAIGIPKWLVNRIVTVVAESQVKKIFQKIPAQKALAKAITRVFINELKQATSLTINAADMWGGYSDRVEGEDALINGFTRAVSPILFHLIHQVCLDKLSWADTDEGQKSVQSIFVSLIAHVLNLSRPSPGQADTEGNCVDNTLDKGIASALQSGSAFVDKTMAGIDSQCIRQIVDQALARMMAEGIELTERNFDELLARVKEIITSTLIKIHADTVQVFSEWNERDPEDIKSERNRLIGQVEKVCSSILQQYGSTIATFFGTETRITGALNELLDEFVNLFRDSKQFEEKLNKAVEAFEPFIIPKIKAHLETLKRDAKSCEENGTGFKTLVHKAIDRSNRPPSAIQDSGNQPVAISSVSASTSTAGQPAAGDEPVNSPATFSADSRADEHHIDKWPATRQAVIREGSKAAGDVAALAIGEFRDNLETVRVVMAPHIEAVMTEAVTEGAAFMARRNGERKRPDTIPGFTAAMTPWLTTSVVELLSHPLKSGQTVTDVREAAAAALTPDGNGAKDKDSVSKPVQVAERVIKEGMAGVLRQGASQLEQGLSQLPHGNLKRLAGDFILHSTQDGAAWLEGLVQELYTGGASDQAVVTRVMDSVTREIVAAQRELVQGVINWVREQDPQAQGQQPHRQQLINLLTSRACSLAIPAVNDVASQVVEKTGQAHQQVINDALPYLLEQLDKDHRLESLMGYGVDWLTVWVGEHGQLIDREVETQAASLVAEIFKGLESTIYSQLKALRDGAAEVGKKGESAVTLARSVRRMADALESGDENEELIGLAGLPGDPADSGDDERSGQDVWTGTRQAMTREGSQLAGDVAGLAIGELRDNLETVRAVVTPHINAVMTEAVNEGAAFMARCNGEQERPGTIPGFTTAMTPWLTTSVVDLLSRRLKSDPWCEETVTDVEEAAAAALTPGGNRARDKDPVNKPAEAAERVVKEEIAGVLREGANQLEKGLSQLPHANLKRLASDFILHSTQKGADWLEALVKELYTSGANDQTIVAKVQDKVTGEIVAAQCELVQGVINWVREQGPQVPGKEPHRQQLINLLTSRVQSLVAPAVNDVASRVVEKTGQPPQKVINDALPYLLEQFDRDHKLDSLMGYGVDWLTDWVDKDEQRQIIAQEIETQTKSLVAEIARGLESTIHEQLKALRDGAAEAGQKGGNAVTLARSVRRMADALDSGGDELIGLACLPGEALDSGDDERPGQDVWADTRQAVIHEGSQAAGAFAGLGIDEIRERLDTVRSIVTPHISEVMKVIVTEGAAFGARRNGDEAASPGISALTGAVPPWLATTVVEQLNRKLLSDAWKQEIVSDVQQEAEQALTPSDETEEGTPAQQGKPPVLIPVADRLLTEGIAEVLWQGVDQLEQAMEKLPFDSLKQLASDAVLQGAQAGAGWLDMLVNDLFADDGVVVSRVIEAVTGQLVTAQQSLVQDVIGWVRKQDGDGQKPHRQQLLDVLIPRVKSLVDPLVSDAAGQMAEKMDQDRQQVKDGVMPYLRSQLSQGQSLTSMVGYSVDWLTQWIDDNGLIITGDVEARVRAMMQAAAPELKNLIHERLATLRLAARKSQQSGEGVVTTLRRTAKELVPGNDDSIGLTAIDSLNELDTDGEGQRDSDHRTGTRQAMVREGSQLAGDMVELAIGEFRDNLEMVRSVMTPHIKEVMTEAVTEGAAFMAQRNGEQERPGTIPDFTAAMEPWLTTSVVELLSRKLMSEAWKAEFIDDVREFAVEALGPDSEAGDGTDPLQHKPSVISIVADRALGAEMADDLQQVAGPLQSAIRELPFASLQKLTSEFILCSTREGAVWLDRLVGEVFDGGDDEVSVVSKVMETVTGEVVAIQRQLVQGAIDWIQGQGFPPQGQESRRQQLVNLLSPRVRSLVNPVVGDVAGQLAGVVVPYLQQQLAKDNNLETLVGHSVDWLMDWVNDHGQVIDQDVKSHVQGLLKQATPELEAAIHKRRATLRGAAAASAEQGEDVVAFARQAAKDLDPDHIADPELVGLAA